MIPNSTPLAVLGGEPHFSRLMHVGTPNIGDRDALMGRLNDILDRRWLTNNGHYVQEFERRIQEYVGVRHCIVVVNATVGLELAIRALGLTGEVIIPSFTFVATAHALQWLGIKPVFCDIDPATHNLDPVEVEKLITPRTSGILGVHIWGRPCAPDALAAIANRHGLTLLFDAAHAFGCSLGDRMIGNFGKAEIFSFHATKALNSLEGGAIVTNDDEIAARLRKMINFGFTGVDTVSYLGVNGKMNEFSAAMGITSLDSQAEILATNARNHALYKRYLADIPGVTVIDYDPGNRSNYHYVALEIDDTVTGITRDDIVSALWAENVVARRYFHPGCHLMEPYRTLDPDAGRRLPHTEALSHRSMLLPNGTAVEPQDVELCCELIRRIIVERVDVRRVLATRT